MRTPILLAAAVLTLLAGCSVYRPIIDPKTSQHPDRYETDLGECRQLAESATGGRRAVIRNCMKGRGYTVLN